MDDVELAIPQTLAENLPEGSEETLQAMQREINQYERYINSAAADGDGPAAAADVVERLEDRWEQYDGYIVELRAWGQSSIYAEVWCDFQYALIRQLLDHEGIGDELQREQHHRLVEDGIRMS